MICMRPRFSNCLQTKLFLFNCNWKTSNHRFPLFPGWPIKSVARNGKEKDPVEPLACWPWLGGPWPGGVQSEPRGGRPPPEPAAQRSSSSWQAADTTGGVRTTPPARGPARGQSGRVKRIVSLFLHPSLHLILLLTKKWGGRGVHLSLPGCKVLQSPPPPLQCHPVDNTVVSRHGWVQFHPESLFFPIQLYLTLTLHQLTIPTISTNWAAGKD